MVGDVRTALLTLLGAVGLLLLVACANVAGLLLARTSARRKELAVRVALGAGRGRLIQQFLAESFWLSLAGGVLGILIAAWAVRVLPAILPANLPRQQGVAINTPVLLFALAAIVAVAVSLGLFAAWRAAAGDLQQALTAGSRGYSGTGASQRLSRLFGDRRNRHDAGDFGRSRPSRPQFFAAHFHESWIQPAKPDHHGVFASQSARARSRWDSQPSCARSI